MIQKHSIILWRKPDQPHASIRQIAEHAYKTLCVFQAYPFEFRPNYLTANSKKECITFDWDIQSFIGLLEKNINREGDQIFTDLGYTLSMFSSLKENESFSFLLRIGNKLPQFLNTLVIGIPLSMNSDPVMANIVSDLFGQLSQTFEPFWGCISIC